MTQFLSILLLFCSTTIFAQESPVVQFEDQTYIDVLIVDNMTYYATTNNIMRINQDNTTDEVIRFQSIYLQGKFTKTPIGWVYVAWNYLDIDVILPNVNIFQYDGITVQTNYLSFLNSNNFLGSIESIAFQSDDEIKILFEKWGDFKLISTDIEQDSIEVLELDIQNANEILLLQDNSHLIITRNNLYRLDDFATTLLKVFDEEIIDLEYFPLEDRILVLTESKIYYLDEEYNTTKSIEIPQSDREPEAVYLNGSNTFLIETENKQSYISHFDNDGSLISTFIETAGLIYTDIIAQGEKIAVWGNTDCILSRNILKIDTNSVQLEIPTSDLAIENLILQYGGEIIDTLFLNNGDTFYRTKDKFDWNLNVVNYGPNQVDSFTISSFRLGPGIVPIFFDEKETILSEESRYYEGTFSFQNNGSGPFLQTLNVFVGDNTLDTNCSDNRCINAQRRTLFSRNYF